MTCESASSTETYPRLHPDSHAAETREAKGVPTTIASHFILLRDGTWEVWEVLVVCLSGRVDGAADVRVLDPGPELKGNPSQPGTGGTSTPPSYWKYKKDWDHWGLRSPSVWERVDWDVDDYFNYTYLLTYVHTPPSDSHVHTPPVICTHT